MVNIPSGEHAGAVAENPIRPAPTSSSAPGWVPTAATVAVAIAVAIVADALFAIESNSAREVPVGLDTLVIGIVSGVSVLIGLLDDDLHIDTAGVGFLPASPGPNFCSVGPVVASPDVHAPGADCLASLTA